MSVLSLSSLAACQGDVYEVDVRLAEPPLDGLGCAESRRGIQSVYIEVFRWAGWDGQDELDTECVSITDDASVDSIESPESLMAWFDRRGYVARSIPTDEVSIVRVRGYPVRGCPTEDVEPFFCAMPQLHEMDGVVQPYVLSELRTTSDEPLPLMVICHAELVPEVPSVCSNSVSARCGDNVCGFNESSGSCEQDCGPLPDLCRWYRACAYFRRP
jgi:hypothetical protein